MVKGTSERGTTGLPPLQKGGGAGRGPQHASAQEPFLLIEQVSKSYGRKRVLDCVSFSLCSGEAVGLAGRNGSGKSTLLQVLAGILPSGRGRISRPGGGTYAVGYVPERFPRLRFTAAEYLGHMARIRGMCQEEAARRIDALLRLCRLEEARHTPIRRFSKGMLQKVGIMQALLEKPDLLLLDEPFSGLDAASTEDLLVLLEELRQEGLTILFSCHEAEHLDRLADRVLQLEKGRIIELPLQDRDRAAAQVEAVMTPIGGSSPTDMGKGSLEPSASSQSVRIWFQGLDGDQMRQLPFFSTLLKAKEEAGIIHSGGGWMIRLDEEYTDEALRHILGAGGSIRAVVPNGLSLPEPQGGAEQ